MKTRKTIAVSVVALVAAAFILIAPKAMAAAPMLSLTNGTDGDSVQMTVTGGAAKQSVVFYYYKANFGLQLSFLGTTDNNGSFSTTLSTAAYGISQDTMVHITVNGQSSANAAWPYVAASKVLSLSQTSLVLGLGNSATLTAFNNGSNLLYLSNNSNPPVANVNISANQITVNAINYGSTVITVCAQMSTPSCASAYITVQNTGAKALAFSQNNATVSSDQNTIVTVIGGTGTYTLLNNSNAGVIKASLNGAQVTLSVNGSLSSGATSVTVCSSDMSACGIINAVISNASSSGLTFSQTNPTMNIGQSLSLSISGGAGGDYSVFANSNTTVVQAGISNNNLVLNASAGGTATITVCSSMGSCAAEVVTVNYKTSTTGGSITLSQNNLWLNAGQNSSITVSGGTRPYSASGYSENILKTSFDNDILTVTGVGPGSASVNVCSAGGGCIILSVLINGVSSNASLSLNQSSLAVNIGQTGTVGINGGGNYFVAYNTSTSVATVTINGSSAVVNGLAAGTADISICQNGGQCAVLRITVSAPMIQNQTSDIQPELISSWADCAGEKQTCSFSGLKNVRYGANDKYYYGIYGNNVLCANSIFGDPIANVAKRCSYGGEIPTGAIMASPETSAPISNSTWQNCAGEKQNCAFNGLMNVRYGANGKYFYRIYTGGIFCANSTFGDPIENVVKQCSYGGEIPAGATVLKFKFARTLAYGASGNEVKELQIKLKQAGLYNGEIDGKYLTSTVAAVKSFQKSQGIKQTGNLGILTIAAINK
jgi:hypothetical protein